MLSSPDDKDMTMLFVCLSNRPSAIPGLLPDEIIVPVSRSVGMSVKNVFIRFPYFSRTKYTLWTFCGLLGVELLRKMGWRHGRAIGPKHIAASSGISCIKLICYISYIMIHQIDLDQFESPLFFCLI